MRWSRSRALDRRRRASSRSWAAPAGAYALTKEDLRGTDQDLCPDAVWEPKIRAAVPLWTSPEIKQKIAAMLAR